MTTAAPVEWKCLKWADCACTKKGQCNCGDICSCGSVSVADVQKAMQTECAKQDCSCPSCNCANCTCGTTERTVEQWVEFVRGKSSPDTAVTAPAAADAASATQHAQNSD